MVTPVSLSKSAPPASLLCSNVYVNLGPLHQEDVVVELALELLPFN